MSKKKPIERPAPTERQIAAIDAAKNAYAKLPVRPALDVTMTDEGTVAMRPQHSDDMGESYRVAEAIGSSSIEFQQRSLLWLINASKPKGGVPNTQDAGAALAFVAAVAPQDELEASLAVQMYAAHDLAMEMMQRAKHADSRPAMTEYGNLATKLSRTFAAQLEALGKLRRGGEQVVRHVHVHEGGQAVVAETVNLGGAGNGRIGELPHAASATVLGYDPQAHGVPIPRDAERQMQDARRQEPRSAEG